MISKKRIIVLPSLALLLGVCGLFNDDSCYRGERVCGYCGSREKFCETSYFVLGSSWNRETSVALMPSRFLIDFPDHRCKHVWIRFEGQTKSIWDSPLVRRVGHSEMEISISHSAIVARYGDDESFRRGIVRILADGTLSRARLLELAAINCMDGGTCQMRTDDPGDAALLALIECPQVEPTGTGQAATPPRQGKECD